MRAPTRASPQDGHLPGPAVGPETQAHAGRIARITPEMSRFAGERRALHMKQIARFRTGYGALIRAGWNP